MINDTYCSMCKSASVLILLLILALQSTILPQSGSIKGHVFDQDLKNPLIGANIIVKGTSFGAAADLNGSYFIRNIPAGTYTFVTTYIGYNSDTAVIKITDKKTVEKDFYLTAKTVEGQTITITAQGMGQVSAIQQQLISNKIVNIVSEERIQELPDFNAAASIGRLPGVSTLQSSGEANKVVIRGLAPQYNAVAINGINLASTGSTQIGAISQGTFSNPSSSVNTDRSVDLSMITPYMIKSIEVFKALTPDMNANAIGGFVNMNLREAPSGFHGDALWQSGYTSKSNKYGNYRAVVSGSNRFFDDMFGIYGLVNIESYDRNADNMSAQYTTTSTIVNPNGYRNTKVTAVTLDRHIETRNRYGGNLILDYTLPSGSIKSVNMFSRLNSNYQDYQTNINYDSKSIGFTYGAGNRNTDQVLNSLELINDFGLMSIDLIAANTYSRNHNPGSPQYQFSQDQSFGVTPINTPPENLVKSIAFRGAGVTWLNQLSLFDADYKENDQVYKGDFKIPLNLETSVSGFIKFGGVYSYNYHTNVQSTPYTSMRNLRGSPINNRMLDSVLAQYHMVYDSANAAFKASNFTPNNSDLLNGFLDNKFGSIFWAPDPSLLNNITNYIANEPSFAGTSSGGWQDGLYQNLPNNYKYIERYYAAYLMSELDFGPDIMVVGGARYEQNKSLFFAYNLIDLRNPQIQQNATFPVTVYPQNHFWLPMIQAKYKPTEWCDIRVAYTQTLARPDYSQISPHFNMSTDFMNLWAGNPNLKTAQAYNHDVELTIHNNDLGLFSVGGFYKVIKNFTYSTQYKLYKIAPPGFDSLGSFNPAPNTGATLYTFINSPYKAYVTGIETDFQTRLWYLPFPLDGLVLGINYTHIWSAARYPYFNTGTINNPNPPPKFLSMVIDSSRGGRLINQPNDIVNAYIGYDYAGFSGRLSFLFQGNTVSSIGGNPENDGFTKNYFRIDASFKQALPWNINIFLDLNNLNQQSNISTQPSFGGFTSEQFYGLTANLGVRYTL